MAESLYYTLAEYLERFGEAEAIRITDAEGAGVPDEYVFAQAVEDASADMDAYLAGRYPLPLPSIPRVLKSVAAALVREKLHGTFPTETVTLEADRARKLLRDLASGTAKLVLEDGDEPETASPGPSGVLVSAPARVFTAETLAKF